jgi:hypothetical protein
MANTPQVYGAKEVIDELKRLESGAINEIRKDLRKAAEPIALSIRSYIPSAPPMSGFIHRGRTSWSPSNIKISVKTNFSKRYAKNEYGIVSLWVGGKKGTIGAAGLQIADMAGKANKVKYTGTSRKYSRNGNPEMTHKLRGQGKGLLDYLVGTPSRYVWRAANLQLPKIQQEVLASLDSTFKRVNKNMQVK